MELGNSIKEEQFARILELKKRRVVSRNDTTSHFQQLLECGKKNWRIKTIFPDLSNICLGFQIPGTK